MATLSFSGKIQVHKDWLIMTVSGETTWVARRFSKFEDMLSGPQLFLQRVQICTYLLSQGLHIQNENMGSHGASSKRTQI